MNAAPAPVVKDLVLLGGGHSHVAVLRRFGMNPLAGVRITLVSPDVHTPYSGMLPGHVAGHYGRDDMHIDLGALCRFADARFYRCAATALDPERRLVFCDGRPPVPFDVLSVNTGATPDIGEVPGAGRFAVAVKPISSFIERWDLLRRRAAARDGPLDVAVVGAGAGGVEILLAMAHRVGALRREAGPAAGETRFHLFARSPELLPEHGRRLGRKFRRILADRGVAVHLGDAVVEVSRGRLRTAGGRTFAADEILWATGAVAPSWPGASGLAVDGRGFIEVDETLRSTSHPGVFAAGDVAAVVGHPRPKSGVFAVRQGRPLARNLRRALLGRPPVRFRPQRRFLSLISTGDRQAVAARGPWTFGGRLAWVWKDRIDRRFMDRYNRLPEMPAAAESPLPAGLAAPDGGFPDPGMRCGGCGSKVGAAVLGRVIARLTQRPRDDVVIGLDRPDDAAVVRPPGDRLMVHTVDFFRAMIDDPYLFGKIAANHCLGDVYAVGAVPRTALAVVTVPLAPEDKTEDLLVQMMSGAVETLADADCLLVGGHTAEGGDLGLGFAINGTVLADRVADRGGLRPGDSLVLTKPIGTGTLLAADMRRRAKGRWIATAVEHMVQSSREAAECLFRHGARTATDVTGFGLLGHLVRIAEASGADIAIDLAAGPFLDGAGETMRMGIESSLQPQNLQSSGLVTNHGEVRGDWRYRLLYDPQTAGGIVAGVPAGRAAGCVEELRAAGYASAAVVGTVAARAGNAPSVRIADGGPASGSR